LDGELAISAAANVADAVATLSHLTAESARRLPWKNGRGVTQELAIWPENAAFERGDFEWRISRATVGEDGPFSLFPGFERVLVVSHGADLVLSHGEHAPGRRVRPLEPYRFSGDWHTSAQLVDGPVSDFNVLGRRGRWRIDVQTLELGRRRAREALELGHAFAHVLTGRAVARVTGAEEACDLDAGESAWIRDLRAGDELDLGGRSDDCVALLVRIAAAAPPR
jgi:environmental stress-induced protein Ves